MTPMILDHKSHLLIFLQFLPHVRLSELGDNSLQSNHTSMNSFGVKHMLCLDLYPHIHDYINLIHSIIKSKLDKT